MSESIRVFDLTPLTRGAAASRRAVIKSFEVRWQVLLLAAGALVPGSIITMILWRWLESAALLAIPITIAAAYWLIEGRSRQGMQLRNWQTLQRRFSNSNGRFIVAGMPFDPLANNLAVIRTRALPTGLYGANEGQSGPDEMLVEARKPRRAPAAAESAGDW